MQGTATQLVMGRMAVDREARRAPAAGERSLHQDRMAARLAVVPAAAQARLGARARRLLRADD